MLNKQSAVKKIKNQTSGEKMYLLKLTGYQMLGDKWKYYRKIKTAGEGFQLLKKKSHLEQMKATRSALRFTSKSARKAYRSVYQSCLKDIKANTDYKNEDFPELSETENGQDPPSLTSEHDAVIISWTPIKFLLPAKTLREKGKATQRHTEGLIAKLFFKVAAYYATAENWDVEKLTFYLRKLNKDSTYQEVAAALEPLKADLLKFSESFELFRFGKASLSKSSHQNEGTFDDAMSVESIDSQVRTLYWYYFIYQAMALFLFRYYLTLVTAAESTIATGYLTSIFDAALERAIENIIIFMGSLGVDPSKYEFTAPFYEYKKKKMNDPLVKNLKTSKGVFQTYNYHLSLLEKTAVNYTLGNLPGIKSEWGKFIKRHILSIEQKPTSQANQASNSNEESREFDPDTKKHALLQIMSVMIKCDGYKQSASAKIMEQFNGRVVAEKEDVQKRIGGIQKQAQKKFRQLEKKIGKLKRMKQHDSAQVFEGDLSRFQQQLEKKCDTIKQNSYQQLKTQKARLDVLLKEMSQENSLNRGMSAKMILQLIRKIDLAGKFSGAFVQFVADNIQRDYHQALEPFYQNMFDVLEPTTQEKILLIQSIEKWGEKTDINLELSETEREQFQKSISGLKQKIDQSMPGIFKGKLIFLSLFVPLKELLKMCLDNRSLQLMLRLKFTTPKIAKPTNLPNAAVKTLLLMNKFQNPVPRVNLIFEGKENERDPQKAINNTLLKKLLAEV